MEGQPNKVLHLTQCKYVNKQLPKSMLYAAVGHSLLNTVSMALRSRSFELKSVRGKGKKHLSFKHQLCMRISVHEFVIPRSHHSCEVRYVNATIH